MEIRVSSYFLNAFFSLTFLAAIAPAHASPMHHCGKGLALGIEYHWCVDSDDSSTNRDVLYYFHGANRSEQSWLEEPENQAIQKEWNKRGVHSPTVISVSFGRIWLMSSVPKGELPSIFDAFTNQIMPVLEAKIGGVKGRRMLKAESMGGFNGIQLLLKTGSLFDRGALACPAITPVGPYSSPFEIGAFIQRNQPYIKPELIAAVWAWTRTEFPDENAWDRHNPLLLLNRFSPKSPQLYISCGKQDEFGFFEGTLAFANRAKQLGATVIWQPMNGGHCAANPAALAKFLVP